MHKSRITIYLILIFIISFLFFPGHVKSNSDIKINELLEMNEEELLEHISRTTFGYFWEETNPQNGLIKDRSADYSPSSIAAVGFGLSAITVAVEREWIDYEKGYQRVKTTLRSFADGDIEGKRGFYYHFVDMETGDRVWDSELSSIDTSLFLAGALTAGEYFSGEIKNLAHKLYSYVDWEWMLNQTDYLCMGWKPESGFLDHYWDHFDEGLLAYILAIGSPENNISAESWDKIKRPVRNDYISLPQESLFVYQYPQAWLDFRNKEDKHANYFNNTARAVEYNHYFTVMNKEQYETYDDFIWGLSASDGPDGYKAYGASRRNHDGTVAPYAAAASLPFKPELAYRTIEEFLRKYGEKIWGEYGFVSAFNEDQNWYSDEHIGIDQGIILMMIENYRNEFFWNLFMEIDYISRALEKIGFERKESDYAVVPENNNN